MIMVLLYEHRRRRVAEVAARTSMSELMHMNRIATAGELSASIAHEVNQPLTGISARASAAARWLAKEPPDIEKVRNMLREIINASDRAAEVVGSVRAMFKKDFEGKTRRRYQQADPDRAGDRAGRAAEERRRAANRAR